MKIPRKGKHFHFIYDKTKKLSKVYEIVDTFNKQIRVKLNYMEALQGQNDPKILKENSRINIFGINIFDIFFSSS